METEQEIADREAREAEIAAELAAKAEVTLDDDGNPIEPPEVELDDDGNPVEKVVADWLDTGEAFDDSTVSMGQLMGMKHKLKGKIGQRDTKIEELEEKLARLEKREPATPATIAPRPKAEDFDTDELHEQALEKWDDARLDAKVAAMNAGRDSKRTATQNLELRTKAVDAHYDRVGVLAEESGISADMFQKSDTAVREAIEAIVPKKGDVIADHIISILGKGSEKVIHFLGVNKAALNEFKGLLAEDPQGLKALVFVAEQKGRLNNPGKKRSSAPPPANNATGDITANQSGAALKRQYDAASKKGDMQAAYDTKKAAKAAKIDVSGW